jgi:N6-L-threonylcarbamoyladenine synthase
MKRVIEATKQTGIKQIAIAGGVSANSGLRDALQEAGQKYGWDVFIPAFEYCTDNAGMIAIAAHYKYLEQSFSDLAVAPLARMPIGM